jgi:hypothetical protein
MSGEHHYSQRKEDAQGHFAELILSTAEVPNETKQQQREVPKKKRSRGNRNLQRFTVEGFALINEWIDLIQVK